MLSSVSTTLNSCNNSCIWWFYRPWSYSHIFFDNGAHFVASWPSPGDTPL